jgi:hypothetical protein
LCVDLASPFDDEAELRRGVGIASGASSAATRLIDAAGDAWRRFIAQPDTITFIGMPEWADMGQTP